MIIFLRYCGLGGLLALLLACQPDTGASTETFAGRGDDPDGRLQILATTSILADVVGHLAGDDAAVTALMGPGVDPHLYKPTQGDLQRLTSADVVCYHGLHLEGKMSALFGKMKSITHVVPASGGYDPKQLRRVGTGVSTGAGEAYYFDPHVWFDVNLWKASVAYVGQQLQAFDTTRAEDYARRTAAYLRRLDSLDAAVAAAIATIPPERRVLITAHDAFSYFGDRYDIEVRGLQGISTVAEYGVQDVSSLVGFIVERGIKAVFVESSVSPRALEAVVQGCRERGHTVRIGGTLYSDALGAPGTPTGTYIGMVDHNVRTIVEGLR